jgi:hypothetical protein
MRFSNKDRCKATAKESALREVLDVFEKNMDLARRFLLAAEAREVRMLIREYRPLAILRNEISPVRRSLSEVYEVGLPMVLVFLVTNFETCLRKFYTLLKGSETTKDEDKAFFHPHDKARVLFSNILGVDPLSENDQLASKARAIIVKRNVIIHRAKEVDKRAVKEFSELGLLKYQVGEKLKLDSEEVKSDLETLHSYVKKVFESIITIKIPE